MKKLLLVLALLLPSTGALALSVPSGLGLFSFDTNSRQAIVYWTYDSLVQSWNMYYDGNLTYPIQASEVVVKGANAYYTISGLNALRLPVAITLDASIPGTRTGKSAALTITAGSGTGSTVTVGQPTVSVDITMTAGTADSYIYLTCNASPCDGTIWNTSGYAINWILEPGVVAAAIPGAPLLAGGVLNVPVAPGLNYLHFSATATATGYVQLHHP